MSERHLAAIRAIYDAYGQGDFRSPVAYFDPQLVLIIGPGFADPGAYVGMEELKAYTRGFLEPWGRVTIAAEEVTPLGDSVLVTVLQRGTGDSSGAVTEMRYFVLWTFRGDKAIRYETFRERVEALRAAGQAE